MMWESESHGALPIEMVPLPFDFDNQDHGHHRMTKSAPQAGTRRGSSSLSSSKRQIASEGEVKGGNLHFMPFPINVPGMDPSFLENRYGMAMTEENNQSHHAYPPSNNQLEADDGKEPWSDEKIRQLHDAVAQNGRKTAPRMET